MATVMNQQSELLMQLTAIVSDMKREQDTNRQNMMSQQMTISDLQNTAASLQEELARANSKLAVFRTPPNAVASSVTRRHLHAEVDQAGGEDGGNKSPRLELPVTPAAAPGAVPPHRSVPAPAPAPQQAPALAPSRAAAPVPAPRGLLYGAEARATAEGNSNEDMFIFLVLQNLHSRGLLKASVWKDIEPPKHYSEHSLLKNTLELVEIVITDEERKAFTADGTSATDLETFSKSIEKRCMNQMLVYEGGDPAVEAQTKSTKKATYLAVGRRVRLYRNELKDLTGNTEPPLQDRPSAPAQATPPDNRSIASFFARRGRNTRN